MHASSLKEFNLLWMYMHWEKFVPASYIPIINSNLPRPPKKEKKEKKDVYEQFTIQSWVAYFQMHWDQFIIVGTWKLLQLASEVCWFRHGATSRWTGLPGLIILLCLAIVRYKLQRLRLGMGQIAKKSELLSLIPLVINQTWVQNFGIENIAPLITGTKTRGWIKFH